MLHVESVYDVIELITCSTHTYIENTFAICVFGSLSESMYVFSSV